MFIIGITGGTASGKTTTVEKIISHYGNDQVAILAQDAYYKSHDHLSFTDRSALNFDHPSAIDFDLLYKHLWLLKKGESIASPIYSFAKHLRTSKTKRVSPKKILIVEGILIFHDRRIAKLLDLKVFLEASESIRLERRIERDCSERGRTEEEIKKRFQNTLKPMHNLYIEPSKKIADVVILNDKNSNDAFRSLLTCIPIENS